MDWDPIDFQGISSVDTSLLTVIEKYLAKKEASLAHLILQAAPHRLDEVTPRLPLPKEPICDKLIDAVESFAKTTEPTSLTLNHIPFSKTEILHAAETMNKGFWDYVEILEGCSQELFQQLEQTSLEVWHPRLADVVGSIKELLLHRMEDAVWVVKRLEKQLWRCLLSNGKLHPLLYGKYRLEKLWQPFMDLKLITHLNSSQEYLRGQYQKFIKRYKGYAQLQKQVDLLVNALGQYPVFPRLDSVVQENFRKLYSLLKLRELNRISRAIPSDDLILALRQVLSIEQTLCVFKDYFKAIKNYLVQTSLQMKKRTNELQDGSKRAPMEEEVSKSLAESGVLANTVAEYKSFLLKTHPDPYVRTRLGFSEAIAGSEPLETKPFLGLEYDLESLNESLEQVQSALRKGPLQENSIDQVKPLINHALHEIIQPLATYRLIRANVEKILSLLQQLNELGSFNAEVIPYVGSIFSKLLRADWKYHAACGFPIFHQLYALHQGLIKPTHDRQHVQLLAKFSELTRLLQQLMRTQHSEAHEHEIELDIHDIKGYLQDFLASIQRVAQDESLTKEQLEAKYAEFAQALMEYRYLFGNFFYQLRQNESEGMLMRRQLLFIDQYFESIESKLQPFRLQI